MPAVDSEQPLGVEESGHSASGFRVDRVMKGGTSKRGRRHPLFIPPWRRRRARTIEPQTNDVLPSADADRQFQT